MKNALPPSDDETRQNRLFRPNGAIPPTDDAEHCDEVARRILSPATRLENLVKDVELPTSSFQRIAYHLIF